MTGNMEVAARSLSRAIAACGGVATVLVGCAGEPAERGDSAAAGAVPDSVRLELVEMGRQDQLPRLNLTAERMQDTVFGRELIRGDSARSARLRVLVEQHGWPDAARAGAAAAQAAFLILQHSPDHAFQKSMVPTLEELAREGRMPRQDVAMLVDRVLMHDGLPQRYGTQFTLVEGRWVLHPVESEADLEERRRAMELPPMEVYMKVLEEFYGAPVVRH